MGKELSSKMEEILLNCEKVKKSNVEINTIINDDGADDRKYNYIIEPILADGEIMGLVLMIDMVNNTFSQEDERLTLIIAQFLGKYLEQ